MTKLFTDLKSFKAHPAGSPRAAVFTMGALHAGHMELVKAARQTVGPDGEVLLTIFVNPTQFTKSADLASYPRTLDADLELCTASGVDLVLAPSVEDVFAEPITQINAGMLGQVLEGVSRPAHFDAVASIVFHLLNLTRPKFTFFGEKDFQQLAVVKHMVQSTGLPVQVVGVPTVRDVNGVALSSRNAQLSEASLLLAANLQQSLQIAQSDLAAGDEIAVAISAAENFLSKSPGIQIDYLEVVAEDLQELSANSSLEIGSPARILIAAYIDGVRLIDNLGVVRR